MVSVPERDSPEHFDWLTFHQDQVAGWFEWLAGQVRQHDTKSVLSNKPRAWTLLQPERGIDWEREAELWDGPGCDAGRSPHDATDSFGWREAAMCFDFQKSVAPDKPLGDFEYHYVHEPTEDEAYVRATYWHSYLHGLRWSNFWVWATGQLGPGEAGAGMTHTAWSQPRVAWGTASAALDLRRLAKYVAAFPGKPEVALYFCRASFYRDNSIYPGTLAAAYEAANGLDAPVGFITDKMIREGKLAGLKLLVIPAAKYVETDVLTKIGAYVQGGGRLLLIGDCLQVDEYGRDHAAGLLPAGAQVTQLDRGTATELVAGIDEAETVAGVARPVRCLRPDGKPAWPVECRAVTVEGQTVVSLVGLNKEAMEVRLVVQPAVQQWTDLLTDEAGANGSFTMRPLSVRLLRVK